MIGQVFFPSAATDIAKKDGMVDPSFCFFLYLQSSRPPVASSPRNHIVCCAPFWRTLTAQLHTVECVTVVDKEIVIFIWQSPGKREKRTRHLIKNIVKMVGKVNFVDPGPVLKLLSWRDHVDREADRFGGLDAWPRLRHGITDPVWRHERWLSHCACAAQ